MSEYPVSRAQRTSYPVPLVIQRSSGFGDRMAVRGVYPVSRAPLPYYLITWELFRRLTGGTPMLSNGFLDNVAGLSWRWNRVDSDCAFSNLVTPDEADGL